MGHLIIISAPSGAGKSTIINHLLSQNLDLQFSISATSRPPRGKEKHGVEYYFIDPVEFREKIANGEFLEYEEVYQDRFYGTLKTEVKRILDLHKNAVFDVDVVGGCNIKQYYGSKALSIFIKPPSIDALRSRLEARGTDSIEIIDSRIEKAEFELKFESKFDRIVINNDLEKAKAEALQIVKDFVKK